MCAYVCICNNNYILYIVFIYMQYKTLIIMISLSSVTLVHTSGIYTEVFNNHSTQFSEAKTTYASKQFLEQQYCLQLGHLKGPLCAVCILLTQTETRRYQQSQLWLHNIWCYSLALLTEEIFHI